LSIGIDLIISFLYNEYRTYILFLGAYMTKESESFPPGFDRAVLHALSFHVGRSSAISRSALGTALSHFHVPERQLRHQIKLLRRAGSLIGSAPGENGGYYLISTPEEFQYFMQTEFMAKVIDMNETAAAMRRSAEKKFGPSSQQPGLF
jgi:hypothetical protein